MTLLQVIMTGIATDYCVRSTAIDSRKFGFETLIVKDAMRPGIAPREGLVFRELEKWGCQITTADEVLATEVEYV